MWLVFQIFNSAVVTGNSLGQLIKELGENIKEKRQTALSATKDKYRAMRVTTLRYNLIWGFEKIFM